MRFAGTFMIDQIYSNADGSVQFVVIRDHGRIGSLARRNRDAGLRDSRWFIQIPNGGVTFADVSRVNYTNLPSDGVHAINGNGAAVDNVATFHPARLPSGVIGRI